MARRQQQSWTPQRLLSSSTSYKDLGDPQSVRHRFQTFLLYHSPSSLSSLLSMLLSQVGKTGVSDYSLEIDAHELLHHDVVLGTMLLKYPSTLLGLLEEAMVLAQRQLSTRLIEFQTNAKARAAPHDAQQVQQPLLVPSIKGDNGTRVHARLIHLPPHTSNVKPSLSSLTSSDVGKVLQLCGTVVRTSKVQMYESQRVYQCTGSTNKGNHGAKRGGAGGAGGGGTCCGKSFVVKADLQQWNNALCPPLRCVTPSCPSKSFVILGDGGGGANTSSGTSASGGGGSLRSDYQEIKVQESISHSSSQSGTGRMGSIPRSLLIKLQHDLVDKCQPGDDVVVVGTLMSHWQNLVNMNQVTINMAMNAHSIRVVHGGGGGEEGTGSTSGSAAGGAGGGGSSWDSIFESDPTSRNSKESSNKDDHDDENDDQDGDNHWKQGRGMVRQEIVKEFCDFWKKEESNALRPIAARNYICASICPALYGLSLVKMALLLTLIGGSSVDNDSSTSATGTGSSVQQEAEKPHQQDEESDSDESDAPVQFSLGDDNNNDELIHTSSSSNSIKNKKVKIPKKESSAVQTRRREQSHLLLVGDPGTGKSQFLRFAAALCPRSVLTSGSGTTSAGLTCAAVRDENSKEFTLEAGALVLADRGVCAIDEFGCISSKDRTTIHECMEQQTLSVAKAGIVCKLNCRATIVAVCNPKGGIYDHEKTFTTNVGIDPPLLSRFDLIFKLIDGSDASKDDNVATFLLNRAIQGSGYECTKAPQLRKKNYWGIEKLRAYIATVKSRFRPSLSQNASLLLGRHYSHCRSAVDMDLQITVRFLESLIRLAQAHARLMFRNTVELDDAIAVILLMECSVASCSSNIGGGNTLYKEPTTYVFPDSDVADIEFLCEKANILERYNMLDRLSAKECAIIQENATSPNYPGTPTDSWDNREEQSFLPQVAPPANPLDDYAQYHQHQSPANDGHLAQDHYGRFTQPTQQNDPSPSWIGMNNGYDSQINAINTNIQNDVSHISQSTKRLPATMPTNQRVTSRRRRSAD